jgi:hypothetical protein
VFRIGFGSPTVKPVRVPFDVPIVIPSGVEESLIVGLTERFLDSLGMTGSWLGYRAIRDPVLRP